MPPKAAASTTPTSSGNNASIAGTSDVDSQVVTMGQLKDIVEQINVG